MEIQTYLQASKENCLKYIVHSWVKWEILILLDMLAKYPNSWPKSIIISSKKGPLFLWRQARTFSSDLHVTLGIHIMHAYYIICLLLLITYSVSPNRM